MIIVALGQFKNDNMQNKISVRSKSGDVAYATTITDGIHTITADEPEADGGKAKGPTPDTLLVMALASCTSITLQMYAGRKGWQVGGIDVDITMHRHEDGTQSFERNIHFENTQDTQVTERMLSVANKCPVHKILSQSNQINTQIV